MTGDHGEELRAEDLRPGDQVWEGGAARFEVASIERHQGRIQVVDTDGTVHSYRLTDTLCGVTRHR